MNIDNLSIAEIISGKTSKETFNTLKELINLMKELRKVVDRELNEVEGKLKKDIYNSQTGVMALKGSLATLEQKVKSIDVPPKGKFEEMFKKIDREISYLKNIIPEKQEFPIDEIWNELNSLSKEIKLLSKKEKTDGVNEMKKEVEELREEVVKLKSRPTVARSVFGLSPGLVHSKITGVGVGKITVSPDEPANPEIGDLWFDTDA